MVILLTNLNNKTNKLNENFFDKIIIKETKLKLLILIQMI